LGAHSQPSDSKLLAKRKIGAPVCQEIYRLFRSVKDELGRNVPIAYLRLWTATGGCILLVIVVSMSFNCEEKWDISHTIGVLLSVTGQFCIMCSLHRKI
jgi:hypothetical protein